MKQKIRRILGDRQLKKILASSIGFLLVRLSSVIVAIVTTPLALHKLGIERYGLWMGLSGIVAMLTFVDFGLGSGLMNITAEESGRNENRVRVAMSNTFYSLMAIVGSLIALLLVIGPHIDWATLFGATSPLARSETLPALLALSVTMLLNIPAGLVSRIQLGNQEGALNAGMGAFNWVLCFIGTAGTLYMGVGLPWVIAAYSGSITLGNWVNFVWEFWVRHPGYRPKFSDVDLAVTRNLLKVGAGFFWLQMMGNVTLWSDYIIVSNRLGVAQNGIYSVAFRLFSVAQLSSYMFRSLWPAFAEMLAKDDYKGAENLYSRTSRLMLVVGVGGAIVLPLIASPIVTAWTGGKISLTPDVCWAFGVWYCIMSQVEYITSLCMASHFRREHTLWYSLASVATLILRIGLVTQFGLVGVILGAVGGHLVLYLIPMTYVVRAKFAQLRTATPAA